MSSRWMIPLAIGIFLLFPGVARSQEVATGRVAGRVVEAANGRPLAGAQVVLQGTGRGAVSGTDGRYVVEAVPAGTHTAAISLVGYTTRSIPGVSVTAGATATLDVTLQGATVQLEGLTVSAGGRQGSVGRAIDEQRTATGVVNAVSAEQIARSSDSDAAAAVKRVSGVTVRDGKYVFVRGLGERYTTASLNGARIASPEPEKKVVPLDLFPAGMLETITTSKTFTPDQPGDFSGARVDLRTRRAPARPTLSYSLSTGFGAGLGGNVVAPLSAGGNWLGFGAPGRELPTAVGSADFASLGVAEMNSLTRAFRSNWSARSTTPAPDASASASLGGSQDLLGQRIGYLGSLTYSRSHDVRADELRARAVPGDASGTPVTYDAFRGSTGTTSTLWGGMLTLSTDVGDAGRVELSHSYNRSADDEAHEDWGRIEQFAQIDSVRRTSLRYVERTVRSTQLRAEHRLGDHHELDASVAASRVTRTEPDRSDVAYGYEWAPTGERLPLAWLGFIPDATKRTFGELAEEVRSADLNYRFRFSAWGGEEATLKLGAAHRATQRDADSRSYNFVAVGLTPEQRRLPAEQIFDGRYTEGDVLRLRVEPNTAGGSYAADEKVSAGYAMLDVPLVPRARLVGGARLERWNLVLDSEPTSRGVVSTRRSLTDVLPALALNLELSADQMLRLSASQTLSRPEYRELSPISYRDLIGEREVFGNPNLERTLVRNYDARWEWYPRSGEILSLGFFAKQFSNPIEPIDVATSGASQLSFTNAKSASNYGVELEVRRSLDLLGERWAPLSVFSNVTLMKSTIEIGDDSLSALTNGNRPMVGQAPYVVNAGLSYAAQNGRTSATLLYNVVGRRMSSAAVMPLNEDTYEMPRQMLNLSLRLPLVAGWAAKLDAKNLLDAPVEHRQGSVVRHRYTTGRALSIGVTWGR